jgi:hypothetical protein
MPEKPRRVREPVQAYLESSDVELLEELAQNTSWSKAEVIRQGIRRLAQEMDLAKRPGAGLPGLIGALDSAAEVPPDLAARHDEYLYTDDETSKTRRR